MARHPDMFLKALGKALGRLGNHSLNVRRLTLGIERQQQRYLEVILVLDDPFGERSLSLRDAVFEIDRSQRSMDMPLGAAQQSLLKDRVFGVEIVV